MNTDECKISLGDAAERARKELLSARGDDGVWTGRLSSSALATAVAVTALAVADKDKSCGEIHRGLAWLEKTQTADGGWGDSPESPPNLSTTLLCWAAFGAAGKEGTAQAVFLKKTEQWIIDRAGSLAPEAIVRAVLGHYGSDRTFSVPILMMCCLAGRLGKEAEAWNRIPPLPFELAALPHWLYAAARLPVVSYALPALIAIGQVIHLRRTKRSLYARLIRNQFRSVTLKKLTRIQPENGGFLEAAPLTGFVVMSLAGSGNREHPAAQRSLCFLRDSMREDGSWPIDTNLSIWATTLAVNALNAGGRLNEILNRKESELMVSRIIAWQYITVHPYTHAAPGGWAWTDLPGGVPDGDDTAGALCALSQLGPATAEIIAAAEQGITWLIQLQNRNGGIPTFCRGWGTLPFDRSCPDITAHAVRAWTAWRENTPPHLRIKIDRATQKAIRYLEDTQRADGAWLPLWFGNQNNLKHENPLYGTAQVLTALGECAQQGSSGLDGMIKHAIQWVCSVQNRDGGWGGDRNVPSTVEETALALSALAITAPHNPAVVRGTEWLLTHTRDWSTVKAEPIGLYFASLWYNEQLYPILFSVSALERLNKVRP